VDEKDIREYSPKTFRFRKRRHADCGHLLSQGKCLTSMRLGLLSLRGVANVRYVYVYLRGRSFGGSKEQLCYSLSYHVL
jgi:hypothetical protein